MVDISSHPFTSRFDGIPPTALKNLRKLRIHSEPRDDDRGLIRSRFRDLFDELQELEDFDICDSLYQDIIPVEALPRAGGDGAKY